MEWNEIDIGVYSLFAGKNPDYLLLLVTLVERKYALIITCYHNITGQ
jgi:hypothetical protein